MIERSEENWMRDDRFTHVVEAQASARVDGDSLTFAGYALPNTRVPGGPAQSFEVLEAKSYGDEGTSLVRYVGGKGAGSYVLRQKWQRIDESWRVISFERPAEMVESPSGLHKAFGFFKKIYSFGPNPGSRGGGRRR
jgi:hypothetical protein